MNCQNFEDVVDDIVREKIMDASLQNDALLHTDDCSDCNTRLGDHRAMNAQLRQFATAMSSVTAPKRIEAQLMQAFDNKSLVKSAPRITFGKKLGIGAVAALFLITMGLSARYALERSSSVAPSIASGEKKTSPEVVPSDVRTPVPSSIDNHGSEEISHHFPLKTPRRTATPPRNQTPANHVTNEVATDFIPVTFGSAANLDAGGQIVRVELPRSALVRFGLPANMDRADEKVKADVLIGVDGLAHAIRFVNIRKQADLR